MKFNFITTIIATIIATTKIVTFSALSKIYLIIKYLENTILNKLIHNYH